MAERTALPEGLLRAVRERIASPALRRLVVDSVRELVDLNTIPTADLAGTARREQAALDLIERRARAALGKECRVERPAILPDIEKLKEYTFPFYAARPDGVIPGAKETYAGRSNLLLALPGWRREPGLAFNAHVDTVGPYFPFSERDGRLFGRGAVDDKGQCAMLLAAASVLGALAREENVRPPTELTLQFVIEEEMGGNGTMSLAIDERYGWGCVVVCEATDMKVHPGNRGATWYRIALDVAPDSGLNATLLAGRVLLELRAEGDRIKDESAHDLFPHRPVQTCNGQFGDWGTHPSRVNPMVGLFVSAHGAAPGDFAQRTGAACARAVEQYCKCYGDATQRPDPDDPARAMVLRHFDVAPAEGGLFVALYGKSGHMGKIAELDCAATKAACALRELAAEFGDAVVISLADAPPASGQKPPADASSPQPRGADARSLRQVVMEGGQGFLPTHSIGEIQQCVREAADRAVAAYLAETRAPAEAVRMKITFERLHNNAFARPVDCPGMVAALAGARLAGVYAGEPLRGWDVSCDSRLVADLCPDTDIVTFGPGQLRYAHSETESITADEILKGAEALVCMALLYGQSP